MPLKHIPPSLYQDWITLLRDEFGDAGVIRNRRGIQEGNVLHALLSAVGNCRGVDVEDVISRAVENARVLFPFIKDFSAYDEKLRCLLKKKNLQKIFSVSDGVVMCEKEVVNRFGDTRRIDRLIVKDEEVRVIDYKSTRDEEEAHQKQVREYVDLIRQIYPERQVKGFVVYLDKASIVDVPE